MKRIIVFALVFIMLFAAASAEMNVSNISDEELLLLHKNIVTEMQKRSQSVVIPMGVYEIGVDLPAGSYHLTMEPNEDADYSYITIFASTDLWDTYSGKIKVSEDYRTNIILMATTERIYTGNSYNVRLKGGEVLRIEDSKLSAIMFTGFIFDAGQ